MASLAFATSVFVGESKASEELAASGAGSEGGDAGDARRMGAAGGDAPSMTGVVAPLSEDVLSSSRRRCPPSSDVPAEHSARRARRSRSAAPGETEGSPRIEATRHSCSSEAKMRAQRAQHVRSGDCSVVDGFAFDSGGAVRIGTLLKPLTVGATVRRCGRAAATTAG